MPGWLGSTASWFYLIDGLLLQEREQCRCIEENLDMCMHPLHYFDIRSEREKISNTSLDFFMLGIFCVYTEDSISLGHKGS